MTDKIERFETKAALSVSDAGEVEAVAWVFAQPDRTGDVIEKNAISLDNATLPILWSHDPRDVIGVWDQITADDASLKVKGRLLIDDLPKAREVRAMIRSGAVSAVSIGFYTRKAAPRKGGGRTISSLDLAEVSIVAVGAHSSARITSAKSATAKDSVMENQTTEAAPELAAIETKIGAVADSTRALVQRLDQIEARVNRPAIVTGTADDSAERKAFDLYVRRGDKSLGVDEVKALNLTDEGVLAPPEFAKEIIKKLVEFSPVRQYARVVTVGATSVKYPRRLTSTTASWVAETGARSGSEPTFDQVTITPHELATYVDVSTQLLEDNAYNLESELAADLGESFGKAEGTAFVSGTGTGQPFGLMTATGIAEITTGAAAGFPASNPGDVIIGMFHALPSAHAQRGVWMMNRTTLGEIRKWKDGNGRYLIVDPISEGAPVTLLGRPIVEAVDMDDIGADNYPVIFGDLQGFRIVDRVALQLLRDPYSLATTGQIRFHARKRVGADVTHPDRFIKLQCAI